MKKILLLVVASFILNNAFSQEAKWGIKAGGNLSGMSDVVEKYPKDDDGYHITLKDGSGALIGFHVGVFANLKWNKIINFQPELLFSMQGAKHKENTGDGGPVWEQLVFKFGYIHLPLLLEIKPIANFGILIGPQLGVNVSRKVTATLVNHYSETFSGSDFDNRYYGLKKFDAAMVFGLQYTIQRVIVGARYNLGLKNSNDFPTAYGSHWKGWKSNVIQASLGFSF